MNRKEVKNNRFISFVKAKYPNLSLKIAIPMANIEWKKLSEEEKKKYKPVAETSTNRKVKLSSHRIPVSFLDNEKAIIEKKLNVNLNIIQNLVKTAVANGNLKSKLFNIIHITNFCTTLDESYNLPAEIAIATFSFEKGVIRRYHSFMNPGAVPLGLMYEAKLNNEKHKLGIPPDVDGEKDLKKVYAEYLEFIRYSNNCENETLIPLFTIDQDIIDIEKCLGYMRKTDLSLNSLNIISLNSLFVMLKKELSEMNRAEEQKLMNALKMDEYEYNVGLSCEKHELLDGSKHCSLSKVTRWSYILCNNICRDLCIVQKRGFHYPKDKLFMKGEETFEDNADDNKENINNEIEKIKINKNNNEHKSSDSQPSFAQPLRSMGRGQIIKQRKTLLTRSMFQK